MDEKVTLPPPSPPDATAPRKATYTPPEPTRRRRPIATFFTWVIVLGLLGAAGYGIYHLATNQTAAPQRQGRRGPATATGGIPTSVGIATAKTGTIHVYVNALGTVTPISSVTIQTQINGTLQEVAFKEGQYVKKGDFLAQIDSRPYEALKAQYEGQLARDRGLLDQARADNARYQTLLQQNSIARQQAEDQIFVVHQYEGTVRIDQALIDAQALNISYCRIVAPIDGRIGLRLIDPGNYVQTSSSTGLAVITQMKPISVLFPVAEDELSEIHPQIDAGKKLEATLFDRTNTTKIAVGSVTTLDNQIDTTTGTVKLRAQVDNDDLKLFPNQFVNVRLLVKTLDDAITVPSAAVQRGAPGTFVYIVGDDDKVSVRKVTVGPTDVDTIAITAGLKLGERVVVDGADRLRDGGSVMIVAVDGKQLPSKARAGTQAGKPVDGTAAPANGDPNAPAHTHRRHQAGTTDDTSDTAPKAAPGTTPAPTQAPAPGTTPTLAPATGSSSAPNANGQ